MSDYPNPQTTKPTTELSAPLVAIYWLIVALPLGWGVYQTAQKSLPLFQVTASAPVVSAPLPATATPPQP